MKSVQETRFPESPRSGARRREAWFLFDRDLVRLPDVSQIERALNDDILRSDPFGQQLFAPPRFHLCQQRVEFRILQVVCLATADTVNNPSRCPRSPCPAPTARRAKAVSAPAQYPASRPARKRGAARRRRMRQA